MSSIIFSAEPSGGREHVMAALASAQQDPSVRHLLPAGPGSTLTLSEPHPVFTLLLGSKGELAQENIEYCCMRYAVMEGERTVAAACVDTGELNGATSLGLRTLTFSPFASSFGAALESAQALLPANGQATVAVLAIPELHIDAMWFKPTYGAGDDIVMTVDPALPALKPTPQTLARFLAALAPAALAAINAPDVL